MTNDGIEVNLIPRRNDILNFFVKKKKVRLWEKAAIGFYPFFSCVQYFRNAWLSGKSWTCRLKAQQLGGLRKISIFLQEVKEKICAPQEKSA